MTTTMSCTLKDSKVPLDDLRSPITLDYKSSEEEKLFGEHSKPNSSIRTLKMHRAFQTKGALTPSIEMIRTVRARLVLSLLFILALNTYGQKIRYKDLKDESSTKNYYQSIENPKYSPGVAGLCNYFIPSAGYFYIQEPVRGACVLGAELVTSSAFVTGIVMSLSVDSDTGQAAKGARALMLSGIIATGIIQIWSIYDVVKIAHIKNLAYQEAEMAISIRPEITINNLDRSKLTTYGIKLCLTF